MARVTNPTPYQKALFRKLGPGDQEFEVLAVRATYRFTEDDGPLRLAASQRPIRWQTSLAGDRDNRFAQVITDDSDIAPGKLGTEVHVHGTLRLPTGKPRRAWQVRVQVGPVDKRLSVRGPREFRRGVVGGWRVTRSEAVSAVPLDYRYAFGGHLHVAEAREAGAEPTPLHYPHNPAGRGWLPRRGDFKRLPRAVARRVKARLAGVTRLPAPQLDTPGAPVTSPFDRPAPAGLGPLAPWWAPRLAQQGTFDDDWQDQRAPYWPADFDPRFHHSAPADLIAPDYLRGDETVILTNCLPGSRAIALDRKRQLFRHRTRLPGIAVQALAEHASGQRSTTPLALDTVGIDLDRGELTLTWRALFPPADPLRRLRLRRTPLT